MNRRLSSRETAFFTRLEPSINLSAQGAEEREMRDLGHPALPRHIFRSGGGTRRRPAMGGIVLVFKALEAAKIGQARYGGDSSLSEK